MKLHQDKGLFSETLRAASQKLNIRLEFVEKDYWITLMLSHLAASKYVADVVFKGGTSLSKGYNLIDRFSEDIDLAILNTGDKSGNRVKTIIRNIEKEITKGLSEQSIDGLTSKGSKYRKSVFEYESTIKNNQSNKLILEINSFANPFPYQGVTIKSLVFDFLEKTGNGSYIDKYGLQPFQINILSKEQTLIEKLVSLIWFSYADNAVEGISGKIRHFYDIYFLANEPDCRKLLTSDDFKKQFYVMLEHDRNTFETPTQWQEKSLDDSLLVSDFDSIWHNLKSKYQTELSAYAYRPIPTEAKVAQTFKFVIKAIE